MDGYLIEKQIRDKQCIMCLVYRSGNLLAHLKFSVAWTRRLCSMYTVYTAWVHRVSLCHCLLSSSSCLVCLFHTPMKHCGYFCQTEKAKPQNLNATQQARDRPCPRATLAKINLTADIVIPITAKPVFFFCFTVRSVSQESTRQKNNLSGFTLVERGYTSLTPYAIHIFICLILTH